jgi:hypothetical protein
MNSLNNTKHVIVAVGLILVSVFASSSNLVRKDRENKPLEYVPIPEKANTGKYQVGAFRCSLWNNTSMPNCWNPIKKYPERQPVLGWYDEGNPEVTDWEIKYATEHGISFFIECWFRKKGTEGKAVEYKLGHWLDSLPKARYRDSIKIVLLWENLNNIAAGIASENDLMDNLMPFWINKHFKQSNYLVIEGKPMFMIYGYKKFVDQLGGRENATRAVRKMKQACINAGFKGLWLIAEHHLGFNNEIALPREVGFDAITSYHWPSFSGLMPTVPGDKNQIVSLQEKCWKELNRISQMPSVPTVSMGWDSEPWGSTYYKGQWYIEPFFFEQVCRKAKTFVDSSNINGPFANMVLLDNWNEYGEGHYIFPTRQFGFGYLDAIRSVFSLEDTQHKDLLPQQIGLGPYEVK